MSPTEFSNYIKQRQMQQHNHFHPHQQAQHQQNGVNGIFGAIGSVSPARSISPNPMTLQMPPNDQSMQTSPHQQQQNPFVFQNQNGFGLNMYQSFGSSPRNVMMDNSYQYNGNSGNDPLLFLSGNNKCSSYLDQQNYCKIPNQPQQSANQTPANAPQQANNQATVGGSGSVNSGAISSPNTTISNSANSATGAGNQQSSDSKLLDQGMNSFYNNSNSSYQHLLVAN
jgi:hypothetical protein